MSEQKEAARLRRLAHKHGYQLLKSRSYKHDNDRGLYQLVDDRNTVVEGVNFDATVEQIAYYLSRVNEYGTFVPEAA
jgi:hypothetical protein